MKKEIKIPTILGIILLIVSLLAGIYLTGQSTNLFSRASSSCSPGQILVTNITHNSVNISFSTESDCSSGLIINNQTIEDNRASPIHYFEVTSLIENTDYEYSIITNGRSYTSHDYQIKTSSKPTSPIPSANLAWGRVFTPDNLPAAESVVYLQIPGATLLSALVTTSGNWNISLASSFNEAKTDWFTPPPNLEEDIIVVSPNGVITQITGNTSSNNPVPDIIIGQNRSEPPLADNNNPNYLDSVSLAQSEIRLDIVNPHDGENINTLQPQFFGTAPRNSRVSVVVQSPDIISADITADNIGNWQWSPPQNLTPGSHTITVTSIDPISGAVNSVNRKFIVLAADSGGYQSFTASASATIITPTAIPTSSPKPSVTTVPAIVTTATPTTQSTLIPTISSSQPSTDSGMPKAGNSYLTVIISALTICLFTVAILIL